jgi:hypothetical protein
MEKDHAREQALAQLASIKELTKQLTRNPQADEISALEQIRDDALDIQVRRDWEGVGNELPEAPTQYKILLCTGGPAVRIKGNLDGYGQPETAQLEYQDWGTPWTRLPITREDIDALLAYAGCFYFGE